MTESKRISEFDRVVIRVPDGVRERLQGRAVANQRSMNAEAVAILEEALTGVDELQLEALMSDLSRVESEIFSTSRTLSRLEDQRSRLRALLKELKKVASEKGE